MLRIDPERSYRYRRPPRAHGAWVSSLSPCIAAGGCRVSPGRVRPALSENVAFSSYPRKGCAVIFEGLLPDGPLE